MRGSSSLKNENALGDENDISTTMDSSQHHDQTPLFLNICSRMFKNKDGLFLPFGTTTCQRIVRKKAS